MATPELLYSSDPGLIIGFHGCDEEIRDRIVMHQTMLKSSKNKWDWLGAGMYFWQNNYERAIHYAKNPPSKVKIGKPAVLGAVFSLGNCLDLSDKRFIDLIQLSYDSLKSSALSEGTTLPVNKNPSGDEHSADKAVRTLDCAVITNVHKITDQTSQPPFDTVRGIFIEGGPLYDGAGFNDRTHVQICIRNPNCIKGFFIPRKHVKWP
jgi:hypothetical protein